MEVESKDQFMSISWSMGQLEVANVDEFLNKYEQDIRNVLKIVSKENNVDYISVNCMDIIHPFLENATKLLVQFSCFFAVRV